MADTSKKPLQGYYNQDGGYVVTEDELNNDTDAQKTGMTWSDAVQQAMDAYAPYKPVESEYVLPEPQQSDYVKDSDWFDTYFPTVSREDEQKRQKQYEQAQRWGLFGNALAAIGNAVGASQGLRPVQIQSPQAPDLQTWKNQLNSDRQRRATAEEQQKARFTTARQAQQTGKQQYARSLNQWQQQVLGAAKTLYNAQVAKDKAAQAQQYKQDNMKTAQDNNIELIEKRGEESRKTKATVGGGTVSHSGGRTGSSGSSGNAIDKMTPAQIRTAYQRAVSQGDVSDDYDNNKDVASMRKALKAAYGKSTVPAATTAGRPKTKKKHNL